MKKLAYGVYQNDDNNFCYMQHGLYKTSIAYFDRLIIKRNFSELTFTSFSYQKPKWVRREVWRLLPKKEPKKLKEKLKDKFTEKRSINVKVLNVDFAINVNN